jgi:hypothetical protein
VRLAENEATDALDREKNGNRVTPEQVIDHMSVDPLVAWAWDPWCRAFYA